ncbi:MAG: filamentous hemagglutinin N-terminal domain-containing protein [Candidatus Brocadiia bacterium]
MYSQRTCGRNSLLTVCVVFLVLTAIGQFSPVEAGPEGENVVRGEASFQRSGDTTTIRASDGSIIEYSDFDIASQELVRFIQPSSSARSLNRVIGGNATDIYGQLKANGIVYLTNPAGIYFHSGSVVDVGGIYAAAVAGRAMCG